jgi:hypothetical protein
MDNGGKDLDHIPVVSVGFIIDFAIW